MDSVYIETSIVSFASAWPSRDIQTAALQQQARDWWAFERAKFDLVTSQVTLNEAAAGDPAAAALAGVKYFLTLNCKHIANAHELPNIYQLLRDEGYDQLLICTPAEFLGGDDDDDEQSDS